MVGSVCEHIYYSPDCCLKQNQSTRKHRCTTYFGTFTTSSELLLILIMQIKMIAHECNLGHHLTDHQGAIVACQGVVVDYYGVTIDHQGAVIANQGAATNHQGATINHQGAATDRQGTSIAHQDVVIAHQAAVANHPGAANLATSKPKMLS
jgi:hypothetical protein